MDQNLDCRFGFVFVFIRDVNLPKNRRIPSIADTDSDSADSYSNFFSQHKYLNFKIGKILLEWQIQQISTNDKHLHEDLGILNSLI